MAKTKRKLLAGLTPGTEEYILAHAEWRRSRGKHNPSECLRNIDNGRTYPEPIKGDSYAIRQHNEWVKYHPGFQKFATVANPHRSLLIAQRHKEQFEVNPEKGEDKIFQDQIISSVSSYGNHSYSVSGAGCGTLYVETDKIIPKVGQLIRFYGHGFGHIVRGVDIEGIEVRYESERQMKLRFKKELMKMDRESKNRFKENEANLDARFELLPPVFQERIANFRRNNLNFRWKYEWSEIYLIEEALRIADFMHSQVPLFNKVGVHEIHSQLKYVYAEEVHKVYLKFYDYSDEQMTELIPDFGGGHSGNSHGFVFRVALIYLTCPEQIPFLHGWLAPIQGCYEYGCCVKKSKKQKRMMVTLEKTTVVEELQNQLNERKKKLEEEFALQN